MGCLKNVTRGQSDFDFLSVMSYVNMLLHVICMRYININFLVFVVPIIGNKTNVLFYIACYVLTIMPNICAIIASVTKCIYLTFRELST